MDIDIPFGDDSMYLFFSRFMQEKIFPDYGPIYVSTLSVITYFTSDIVTTSQVARIFHLLLPALAIIYVSFRYQIGWGLTALFVVGILSSPWIANFGFFRPLISHPAVAIILVWIGWIKGKSLKYIWSSAIVLTVIVMYYRPEQILSYLFVCSFSIVVLILQLRNKLWTKESVYPFIALYSISLLIVIIVGKPIGAGGKRSGLAILQHVSLNYLEERGDDNAWQNHVYFMDYLPEMFGLSQKIKTMPTDADILFEKGKPLLFMHFKRNIINYMKNWLSISHILLPNNTPKILCYILTVILFAIIFVRRKFILYNKEILSISLILSFFVGTITATSILIYPRVHYFLFTLPIFYFITMEVLIQYRHIINQNNFQIGTFLLAICYLLLMPSMKSKPLEKLGSNDLKITHIPAIRTLNSLNITDTARVLDRDMGLILYMPRNYQLTDFNMDTTFLPFIENKRMNVIYLNHTLRNDKHFATDSTFRNFVSDGYKSQFQKIHIPTTSDTFIIAKSLLQ
jgi:hypothetical protein